MSENTNYVEYLENVLSSWGEFCKHHSKFEEALKEVLEENKRLKAKSVSSSEFLSYDGEIEHQIVIQQMKMNVTFTKAEAELIRMALKNQLAYISGGWGLGRVKIATAVQEIAERIEDVWKADFSTTPKSSTAKKTYDLYEDEGLSAEDLRIAYRTITGLDNDNEFTDNEIFKYLLDSLKEEEDRGAYFKKVYPKTVAYVDALIQPNLRCNACSSIILKENESEQSSYQCMYCDVVLSSDEVHEDKPCEATERFDLYVQSAGLLCLDD